MNVETVSAGAGCAQGLEVLAYPSVPFGDCY